LAALKSLHINISQLLAQSDQEEFKLFLLCLLLFRENCVLQHNTHIIHVLFAFIHVTHKIAN
jgi:hypothetical protein